jgi:hypothetical protein
MFLMWVRTVWGLRYRSPEMSSMECPRAICSRTSHSRSESVPERGLLGVAVDGNVITQGILPLVIPSATHRKGGIQVEVPILRSE